MKNVIITIFLMLVALATCARGAELLVPTQYPTIQSAIDAAVNGDTVIIAPGTYTGLGNRGIDFLGKAITVRSENGPENCVIDCNSEGCGFDFSSGEDANSVLDGFTITNGYASQGGGILCEASPTIINCNITRNSAKVYGGGIYGCGGLIANCIITNNSARYGGGLAECSGPIINCTITGNSAIGYDDGGGLYHCHGLITNCTIAGNSAGMSGGGLYGCDGLISNCTIAGNSAAIYGGGIYSFYPGNPIITNCILWGNTAEAKGNQIALRTPMGSNISSTLMIAYSDVEGGLAAVHIGPYCSVIWDSGNIDADPLFTDEPNSDYHLLPASPCINTGDPNYVPEPNETDLDGLPRVIGGRVDMGAYEFNHQPVAVAGPNQTVYAWINGFADVNLDASASYDDDNDVLDYYWSWTIDGNTYEANDITPTIKLPVGKHTIELVVDDGIDLSEPNYCTITVIKAVRGKLLLSPRVIETKTCGKWIIATFFIPPVPGEQINKNEPLRLYPSGIEATYQRFYRYGFSHCAPSLAIAFFDKQQVIDALGTGQFDVSVVGKFLSGRFFFGSDTIRITSPPPTRPWWWRRY